MCTFISLLAVEKRCARTHLYISTMRLTVFNLFVSLKQQSVFNTRRFDTRYLLDFDPISDDNCQCAVPLSRFRTKSSNKSCSMVYNET